MSRSHVLWYPIQQCETSFSSLKKFCILKYFFIFTDIPLFFLRRETMTDRHKFIPDFIYYNWSTFVNAGYWYKNLDFWGDNLLHVTCNWPSYAFLYKFLYLCSYMHTPTQTESYTDRCMCSHTHTHSHTHLGYIYTYHIFFFTGTKLRSRTNHYCLSKYQK